MSDFSISWLDLRETADHYARAPELLMQAQAWLATAATKATIVDLGAGTGSTLRALHAPELLQHQWQLVDHDPALLAEAQRRHGNEVLLQTHVVDLADVAALPLSGARLVCASALFDLASAQFCDALIARLSDQAAALYAALNYDGHMQWSPAHPLDAVVLAAFNLDQQRDKGLGPALGPSAAQYLHNSLERAGYAVEVEVSPWLLGPQNADLVRELCLGCASAVADALDPTAIANWLQFRLEQADSGECVVGHLDVWAHPH